MTLVVTILKGSRYTFWNVSTICFTAIGLDVTFTDKPTQTIQGYIAKIERKDSID